MLWAVSAVTELVSHRINPTSKATLSQPSFPAGEKGRWKNKYKERRQQTKGKRASGTEFAHNSQRKGEWFFPYQSKVIRVLSSTEWVPEQLTSVKSTSKTKHFIRPIKNSSIFFFTSCDLDLWICFDLLKKTKLILSGRCSAIFHSDRK